MQVSVLFSLFFVPAIIARVFTLPTKNLSSTLVDELVSIPDVNGIFYQVNITALELEYAQSTRADIRVTFRLVSQQCPDKGLRIFTGDVEALKNSHFDPRNPTRILVHGWRGDKFARINLMLAEAYLKRGHYNIIVVDWSDGANTLNYFYARKSVDVAARKLAELIDFLVENGQPLSSLHMVGHSLGAHLCGIAAKYIRTGRVGSIIGLEAALPLFSLNNPSGRLDPSDADYVQTIHTNGGVLGFAEPLGHGSFYPNYGRTQPNCGFDITGSCSHSRVVDYFAESLEENNYFFSVKCTSLEVILNKKCANGDFALLGGDPVNANFKGVFFVPVNAKKPYGTGKP